MKKLYAITFFFLFAGAAFSQKVTFIYNEAGIRVKRLSDDALPVTLIDFRVKRAQKPENMILLYWATAAEQNCDHFAVERSSDGKFWTMIHAEPALGNSKNPFEYETVDESPVYGDNYYRLRIIDKDGSFTFSKVRRIYFEAGLALYPNPVSDRLFLRGFEAGRINIFDVTGRLVLNNLQVTAIGLDVSRLSPGIYIAVGANADGTTRGIQRFAKK